VLPADVPFAWRVIGKSTVVTVATHSLTLALSVVGLLVTAVSDRAQGVF
jgi:hypothetical protein